MHLYIYIALLAVHTMQKRFQCESPRGKRENEKRHLAHQLIKWIVLKEEVGSKAKGQEMQRLVSEP